MNSDNAKRAIRLGTAVTRKILDNLGSPDKKLKIIHIAGTNGKGSTAEFFTQILIAANKRVGTFTSPMVYDYGDQFRINAQPIPDDIRGAYFAEASKAAKGLDPTLFEIETAGTIYAFYREGCEYAVLECGMGGLTDATNAVSKKELAVLTSVSLEHTSYLGDTVLKICKQKSGIISDCPAVVNSKQCAAATEYFKSIGARIASEIAPCGDNSFTYNGKNFKLSVYGSLQPYNAATAIEGARILGIDEKSIYNGIKNAKPYGRLQKFERFGKVYILDGAHNPEAFIPLKDYLDNLQGEKTIIFGCLADKDIDGNLKTLCGASQRVIAVECKGERALSLENTTRALKKYFKNVTAAESVGQALSLADTQTVVVCGSFTLLREAKEWIER